MSPFEMRVLLPETAPVDSLAAYRALGGGEAYALVQRSPAEAVIDEIGRAGLRGRGGAGFPTAMKWRTIQSDPAATKYICCNGAEGEPGTFKDRYLLRSNPYQVIEGLAIAALVTGAQQAYLCLKHIFDVEIEAVSRALEGLRSQDAMGHNIEVVLGPDEYLFGEEKALLEVVEGGLPLPRVLPPYMHGLFGGAYGGPSEELNHPTIVNNVETLAHVTNIVRRGADWFRSIGSSDTPGTIVFTVSGDVLRPVVVECPLGLSLRNLILDVAGGPPPGRRVKAVFPGVAAALLTEAQLDTPLTFDSMRQAGSALGSGGFIVYDDSGCMVQVAYLLSRFLHVESCDQCPPCKLGSGRITQRLERLLAGEAEQEDLDEIAATATWVTNGQRCYLPTSEAVTVAGIVNAFPEEFRAHLEKSCSRRHDLIVPKMIDYVEGQGFVYDQTYARKQPDWTYAIDGGLVERPGLTEPVGRTSA